MFATVGEADPRTQDQHLHRAGHQDLTRLGEGASSGADVDRQPGDRLAFALDLAGVQPGPDLDADVAHRLPDRAGTPDGPGGPVEGGEEAVPGGVHLAAAESLQQLPSAGVMLLEQVPPTAVTELSGFVRRPDNVGEHDGSQAPVEIRRCLPAGQELLNHIQQGVGITDVGQVIGTGQLGIPGVRDQFGCLSHRLQVDQRIAGPVEDQRPGLDRRENRPQIGLHRPAQRRRCRARRRRQTLPPPVPGQEPEVVGPGRGQDRDEARLSPRGFDRGGKGLNRRRVSNH